MTSHPLILILPAVASLAAACRKPDPGRPDTGGPLVVVAEPDAGPEPPLRTAPPGGGGRHCLEDWRVSLPAGARLLDLAAADGSALLLVERDGSVLSVLVGDGGQASAAVIQDFLPDDVRGRLAWGRWVPGRDRALALYGWTATGEPSALYARAVRFSGALIPGETTEPARRRYFAAAPRPDWEVGGDPAAALSRVDTLAFGDSFLVQMDVWKGDVLEGGRLRPQRKHLFSVFGSNGRRAGGWDLRTARRIPPAPLGAWALLTQQSEDRPFELVDHRPRRQSGPLLDAVKALPGLLPVGGACPPRAGEEPADCFALLAPQGAGLAGLERLRADGSRTPWKTPADLAPDSTLEAVLPDLIWARAADGSLWAAGPDGVASVRVELPEAAVLRRYAENLILAGLAADGRTVHDVVACQPGGTRAEPARAVPLDGALDAARAAAAGTWNEQALRALDDIEERFAAAGPGGRLAAEPGAFDVARAMAARAAAIDPSLDVALLTRLRLETLAGDDPEALRLLGELEAVEPGRRGRLFLLACRDARFRVLRWHPDLGAALGCVETPADWFLPPAADPDAGLADGDAESPDAPPPTVMPALPPPPLPLPEKDA